MFLDLKPIKGRTIAFGGMGKGKITNIDLEDDFADIQIGPSLTPKEDEVKQPGEILPQTRESSDQ